MKTLAYPLLLVAATAALAGCAGGDPAPVSAAVSPSATVPAAVAAVESTAPGVPCGEVPGAGGAKTAVVAHGKVDCAAATKLLKDYFAKLTPAEAASADGPGPVVLDEWTCGSGPNDPVTACSTEDGRQVEGTRA
ncbi:hypothetical protein DMA12_45130 [Amycolatopsis balhimycina DSM 5908]|uniref:Uncharacterized protein n=1 Tax=Amycolatopsis balhimycina DSM 5908 TaxID=1081091 RepID=A0A428VWQ0_AMYBA|nr:hypothetical protein [Amycolatopsis balhimycina]RSM35256.1 hypothetical protein DMA12_45130 [Amycolatopsis balhimycina DSM 5908]